MENTTVANISDYFQIFGDEDMPLTDRAIAISVPIIIILLMIIGVLGNATLIFIVLRNKAMRNVPNIFIVSLSCGDLILLIMSAPFSSMVFSLVEYPFPDFVCKVNEYLQTFSVGVSVFTLTALSGDRYVAIVYPMSKHKGKPMLKTIIIVSLIWTLSAILAIPDAIAHRVEGHNGTGVTVMACNAYSVYDNEDDNLQFARIHVMFRFVILFLIPLLIIGAFYCMMARILIKSSKQLPMEAVKGTVQNKQQQRQIEARMKVARVVLSFVILFVICWLPRHIYMIWFYFSEDDFSAFWIGFKIVGFCLTYVYSSINPYALYFLSSQFRKYYDRYLFRCLVKNPRLGDNSGSSVLPSYTTLRRGSPSLTAVNSLKSNSDL